MADPGMRVLVFGSSVPLAIRPRREDRTDGTYVDLLRRALKSHSPDADVVNLASRSRLVTHESDIDFTASVQRFDPDLVILHYGINEAAPRAIPYRPWMWLHAPQNCGKPKALVASGLSRLYPTLIRLFKMRGWVEPQEFGNHLSRLIGHCRKESTAAIVLVNLGPPSPRYERMLPGVHQAITQYNHAITEVAQTENVGLVDAYSLVKREGLDKTQPDGAHLSPFGHRCLFDELLRVLEEKNVLHVPLMTPPA